MFHAIHRVEQFTIVDPCTLSVRFGNGTIQRIDSRSVRGAALRASAGPLDVQSGHPRSRGWYARVAKWGRRRSRHVASLAAAISDLVAMARDWSFRVAFTSRWANGGCTGRPPAKNDRGRG